MDAGLEPHHIPYSSTDSHANIMKLLDEIHAKKERVVAHCTHGMGRSGRVAAGWLMHHYNLNVEEAVTEALDAARKFGVERMGSPQQLQGWAKYTEDKQ